MALPISGQISMSAIDAVLGKGKILGNYRNQTWFTPQGNNGIFAATGLKMSDFYNKTNIPVLTEAQLTVIRNSCLALYLSDPTIWFSVLPSGQGNFGTLYDTRLTGGYSGVSVVTTGYNSLFQNISYPVGDMNNLPNAMSLSDFIANFITPVGVVNYNPYAIFTATSVAGYTLVSSTPMFIDTRAIPNTDTATTIANYYLHRKNIPAFTDLNTLANVLLFATPVDINVQFKNLIKHCLLNVIGHRLRYNYNGEGINLGTVMTDTRLNSSIQGTISDGQYQYVYYRPYGAEVTISAYALRAYQV